MASCVFTTTMNYNHFDELLPAHQPRMTVARACQIIEEARNIGFHGWASDGAQVVRYWLTPENSRMFIRQAKLRRPDELVLEVILSRKIFNRQKPRRYQYLEGLIDYNCELQLQVCQRHGENQHFKILFRGQEIRQLSAIPCKRCIDCGNVSFIEYDK